MATTKRHPGRCGKRLGQLISRGVLGLLAVLGLVRGAPAAAQADVALQALTVELWPEFDQPAVLVILRATLDPAVPLPATVTLHLPAGVAGPSAVAGQDPSGQLVNTAFTVTAGSAAVAVEVQTAYASFQVEFYDTTLQVAGEDRTYTFQWQADFPVTAATLRVQEPAGARDLTTTPAVALAGASGLGLNYYTAALGALTTGQTVTVDLRYAKPDATLSQGAVAQNAAPAATSAAAAASSAQTSPLAPTVVIGGAFVMLAALGFGAGRALRARISRGGEKTRPRSARPPAGPAVVTAAVVFCTQCGQPIGADDRFCRKCGAPRRGLPPAQSPG